MKRSIPGRAMGYDQMNEGFSSARSIAIGAGDLSIVVRREVARALDANGNDVLKSLIHGLKTLSERNLISAQESTALREVCRHLISSIRGKEDGEDAFLAIKDIYHEMLMDHKSSSVALAIASVAGSAFDFEKSNSVTITPGTTGAGAVVGAVIGGVMGGLMGGPWGAGVGAAIGGAAGAAIGWCNENGK